MATAKTTVNIPPLVLAKYLNVTLKQRERAATKFVADYGPNSATVAEITAEIATLRKVINHLESGETEPELIPAAQPKK